MIKTSVEEKIFKLLSENSLNQAYAFFGPSPLKEDVALKIANFLENGNFSAPTQTLIDVKIIKKDGGDKIGIDEIRVVKNFVSEKPLKSKKRMVIVSPFENFTKEAEPALLKITEDATSRSLFIFIGNHLTNLNQALASRVSKIFFPHPQIVALSKNNDFESELENIIIKLYLDSPRKNLEKIKFLLDKKTELSRFNLNEKLQRKNIENFL